MYVSAHDPIGNTFKTLASHSIAGQRTYVVTSPQDVSSIYRNTATLKFDEHVEYRRKMYEIPGKDRTGIIQTEKSRHLHKALAHAVEDFYRQQLYPGNHLDDLWTKIQSFMHTSLFWENISKKCTLSDTDTTKALPLLKRFRAAILSSQKNCFRGQCRPLLGRYW